MQDRIPGEMGRRLHQILPDGGTKDFAKLILEIAEKQFKMELKSKPGKRLHALSLIYLNNRVLWTTLFILFFFSISCASGSGKFYDWCEKREFPAICKKYFY